jgi:hypothetical protein
MLSREKSALLSRGATGPIYAVRGKSVSYTKIRELAKEI